MPEEVLRLGVDARPAKTGSDQYKQSMDEIIRSARAADAANDQLATGMDALGLATVAITRTLGILGVTFGAGAMIRGLIQTNREFERLTAQLQTTEGSAAGAARAFQRIEKFAIETPFSIEELTEALIQLRVRGAQPTDEQLRALGDLASSFGVRITDVSRAISSAAAGETESIRRLGFQVRNTGNDIEISFAGTSKTVERNAGNIVAAIDEITDGKLSGAMAREMATINGAVSNLWDNVGKLARAIGGSGGLNDAMRQTVDDLSGWTQSMATAQESMETFSLAARGIILEVGTVIRTTYNAISGAAKLAVATVADVVAATMRTMGVLNEAANKILPEALELPGIEEMDTQAAKVLEFSGEMKDGFTQDMADIVDAWVTLWENLNNPPKGGPKGGGPASGLDGGGGGLTDPRVLRELEQRIQALQQEMDARRDAADAAREWAKAAREATQAAIQERFAAEGMLAAKKAGKAAEDAFTVALAMQAAVRENLGKVSNEQLVIIAEEARRTAQAAIDTQAFTDAQQRQADAAERAAEAQKKHNAALKDYAASAALGVATGMLANGGDTGKIIGGIVGGAAAGYKTAGPWGAVIGGAASAITSLFNMGKEAREAAKRFAEAQDQFSRALDDAIRSFDIEISGTEFEQQFENIRLEINKWIKDAGEMWRGARKVKPIDAETPVDEWLVEMQKMIRALGEEIAMRQLAGEKTGELIKTHEDLIRIYELTDEKIKAAAEAQVLAQASFDEELAMRELSIRGRDKEVEAMRRHIAQREELEAAMEKGYSAESIERLKAIHNAEHLAAAEAELNAERERQARFLEDVVSRALEALGRSEEAARYRLQRSQSAEYAAASDAEKPVLAALHQIEMAFFELGVAIEAVEAAAQEQIDKLQDQIDRFDRQLELTEEQIRLHEATLSEMQRVVESLQDFQDSLKLGPLTTLSPADQLAEAERQFNELYKKAMAGDADAAAALPAAAQAFLEASRNYNASGPGYQEDFLEVLKKIEKVEEEFADRATIEEQILDELRKQSKSLEKQIQQLREQQDAVREAAGAQIAALKAEFDSKSNALWGIIQMLLGIKTEELTNIESFTDLERRLRGEIATKEGIINALEDAYKGLAKYYDGLLRDKDEAYGRELKKLVDLLNQLMGTQQSSAQQAARASAAAGVATAQAIESLRSEVVTLGAQVTRGLQESRT